MTRSGSVRCLRFDTHKRLGCADDTVVLELLVHGSRRMRNGNWPVDPRMSTSMGSRVNKKEVSALSCFTVKAMLTATASRLGLVPREKYVTIWALRMRRLFLEMVLFR